MLLTQLTAVSVLRLIASPLLPWLCSRNTAAGSGAGEICLRETTTQDTNSPKSDRAQIVRRFHRSPKKPAKQTATGCRILLFHDSFHRLSDCARSFAVPKNSQVTARYCCRLKSAGSSTIWKQRYSIISTSRQGHSEDWSVKQHYFRNSPFTGKPFH